jgi:hypothetical protein
MVNVLGGKKKKDRVHPAAPGAWTIYTFAKNSGVLIRLIEDDCIQTFDSREAASQYVFDLLGCGRRYKIFSITVTEALPAKPDKRPLRASRITATVR